MTELAARFAFAGNAFLRPEPERIVALAREVENKEFASAIETAADSLEPEYNRLFLNPQGTPCPLWQSAHHEERRLMGEAHLSALEWFRRYEVEPVTQNDPADHVGLLLLFYARLLEDDIAPEERARFAAGHLAWVPAFCQGVESETRHPFFRLLANETRGIVEQALAR